MGTLTRRFIKCWNQEALSLSGKSGPTHVPRPGAEAFPLPRRGGEGRGGGEVVVSRYAQRNPHIIFRLGAVVLALLVSTCEVFGKPSKSGPEPILLVVMDP